MDILNGHYISTWDSTAFHETYAKDAFISFKLLGDGSGAVPYLPQAFFDDVYSPSPPPGMEDAEARFHQIWFKNRNTGKYDISNNPQNYFHLIGATSYVDAYGKTWSSSDYNFIFVRDIETDCGADATCKKNLNLSTTLHELAHQFDVNLSSPCVGGHDPTTPNPSNNAWCGDPGGPCASPVLINTRCLMSGAIDATQWHHDIDEYNHMECEDLGLEEVPNNCPNQDCGLGIRNQNNPM
jgi:hypothetical protein